MKRFVFFVVCALMLAGCATQNVDKEKDNQSTTSKKVYDSNNQKEQAISTSNDNMFEIKNGVLVRYKGGYNKVKNCFTTKSERNCLKGIYSYKR